MEPFLVLLIPACILWSWLSPVGFLNRRLEGAIIQVTPIPLLARIKRHAFSSVLTMLVSLALVLVDYVSPWWLVPAAVSAVAILLVPQAYIITTRGIRIGPGRFRRWTEFAGVYRSRAGASLQVIGRGPDVRIWLSGSREDDEFVHLLRRMIRDSYKGKATRDPEPSPSEETAVERPELLGIAAATPDR